MYILEPFLNTYYRMKMRSVLNFKQVENFDIPEVNDEIRKGCLLYIHVPFCQSLCPYCSFHRYEFEADAASAYFSALRKELRMYKERGYQFQSIYVGGGTPTIDLDNLLETLALARELYDIREISCETNPNHLIPEVMDPLVKAGVNRLSVGVQTFDDRILKQIGRYEKYGSSESIRDRLKNAMGVFDTLNLDLIFNMPTQDDASIARDLDIIDEILADQVTFYPLMTAPSVRATLKKTLGAVSYIREKRFYQTIQARMKKSYVGSTAWCFSRKKSMIDEYVIAYDHYAGLGSGAFGYVNDCIYANTFSIEGYIDAIKNDRFPVARIKKFDETEYIYYYFLMKLFGLSLDKAAFEKRFGRSFARAFALIAPALKLTGSITEDDKNVYLTDRGKYFWVMAMREFFTAVDTLRDDCRTALTQQGAGPF